MGLKGQDSPTGGDGSTQRVCAILVFWERLVGSPAVLFCEVSSSFIALLLHEVTSLRSVPWECYR